MFNAIKRSLSVYYTPKLLIVLVLGFSSGLPLALTGGTLQAWLTAEKIGLKTIGVLSLIGLPYSYKFIWAPLVDRYTPPMVAKTYFGRRIPWILLCQCCLACCCFLISSTSPINAPILFSCIALSIAFFSASQDIVIDAYRTEVLNPDERGPGVGVAILGYRLAMLTSGALALIFADQLGWHRIYQVFGWLFLVLGLLTIFAPLFCLQTTNECRRPLSLADAVILPLYDLFSRHAAVEILLFVLLYKLGDVMAVAITTRFMLDLGFSNADIGYVVKGFGMLSSVAGSLVGGLTLVRLGLKRSLIGFGFLQGLAILCFAVLAVAGKSYWVMCLAITLENFANGLGNAALLSFIMGICNLQFTASQFALLTSLQSFSRTIFAATTGILAEYLGWPIFFLLCTALASPGLILLWLRFDKWQTT